MYTCPEGQKGDMGEPGKFDASVLITYAPLFQGPPGTPGAPGLPGRDGRDGIKGTKGEYVRTWSNICYCCLIIYL